jgi:adenylate cyclase class 2
MSKDHIEKEIKVRVKDIGRVNKLLKKHGAKYQGKSFQKTVRFDTPNLDHEKRGTFLRVRSGHGNTVTMKKKIKSSGDLFERIEIETEVKDIEKLRAIFNELGLTKEFIMEKHRANWLFNNTMVSIDELPFGFFVEIEGEEPNISNTTNLLGLDAEQKITVTYWDIFEDYKKEQDIEGEHIVFPKNHKSKL